MSISFIYHKSNKILYIDYSICNTIEEFFKMLDETKLFYVRSNEKFLCLNNFTGVPTSDEFIDLAKKYGKEIFDPKNIKEACIGISGIQKIQLGFYNLAVRKKIMPFDTKDEALEYLVN